MVTDDRAPEDREDWTLPKAHVGECSIRLVSGELSVVDYVLHTGSGLLLANSLSDVVDAWHSLRTKVWRGIILLDHDSQSALVVFSEAEAKVMLAAVPPSMTFGDGVDYGHSLKMKLANMLQGTYVDAPPTDKSATEEVQDAPDANANTNTD